MNPQSVNQIERLRREGLLLRDTLSFLETADSDGELVAVVLKGRVYCTGGVVIRMENRMRVRRGVGNRHEVQTADYQCHAWVRARPGPFDQAGAEFDTRAVAMEEMPTLEDFVRYVAKAVR